MKNKFFELVGLVIFFMCFQPCLTTAQLHISGETMVITSGAIVHCNGDITNTEASELTNEGTLSSLGNISNSNSATLQGSGQYTLEGHWTNAANFSAGTSTVTFTGAQNSTLTSGDYDFHRIEMDKTNGSLLLADDAGVGESLEFLSSNNKVILAGQNLMLHTPALIMGYDETSYIVTGSDGEVVKSGLDGNEFTFPVGFDATSYNPLALRQHGTADKLGIRCHEKHFENGNSGDHFNSEAVDASWEITQPEAGDNDLEVRLFWHTDHELSFDRTDCAIGFWNGSEWDYGLIPSSPASGTGPIFHQFRTDVYEPGILGIRSGMGLVDVQTVQSDQSPLVVYPNPFTDKLHVVNAHGDISIFDMNGRLLLQSPSDLNQYSSDPVEMDLGQLPGGVYLLKTRKENGQMTSIRVIKTK